MTTAPTFLLRFCSLDARTGEQFSQSDSTDQYGHDSIEAARAHLDRRNHYGNGNVFVDLTGLKGKQFDYVQTVEIIPASELSPGFRPSAAV